VVVGRVVIEVDHDVPRRPRSQEGRGDEAVNVDGPAVESDGHVAAAARVGAEDDGLADQSDLAGRTDFIAVDLWDRSPLLGGRFEL
jgi:hypothetical protein